MSKFELNKLFASVILAILIVALIIKFANFIYAPSNINLNQSRGYSILIPANIQNKSLQNIVEAIIDIKKLIETASLERGKSLVKKCISCHSFEENGPNKIGPNLFNIYNKNKASNVSYKYSEGFYKKGGVWAEEELFVFLKNPKKYIDGTKMSFPGLDKPEEIADIILFIKNNTK